MRRSCAVVLAALVGFAAAPPTRAHKPVPKPKRTAAVPLPCGDYLSFQVLLDRQGFSPGEIDGKPGDNFTHAIAALQQTHQLPATTKPDCDTWHALGGDTMDPALTTYTVTETDMKGPFAERIPDELMAQAKLPALAYRSPLEMIAERFHASPALLQRLNHSAALAAGREIRVPNVPRFDENEKPRIVADPGTITIEVSREDSALRAVKSDGSLAFFAPVTTGSEHDPLPPGMWKVTGLLWHPVFHYNPQLFWDAKANDARATIKPGPNNPVGVAWISLDLEHYGLHGTPEPGRIGHAESHGCVRLTNWDVTRVASLVTRGTPVIFK
jgi:lipoprotein-anchoring transpeptidase ErfK/SrfK